MHQEDLARQFCRWYRISHGYGKTVCLLGIRADESLQRYSGFHQQKTRLPGYLLDQQAIQGRVDRFAPI